MQKEEGKPFPHAPPTLLLLSYSCTMYTHICSSSNCISSGQDGGCILHYFDTLTQPSDLHSEECRSQTGHEKAMVQQILTRDAKVQKMPIANSATV